MERSQQNKCVVGNKDDGVDNSVDNSDDGTNKHLAHLSQAVDCSLMDRSKQNKCVVGNKDDGVDDSVGNSVDDSVDNSDDGANKYLSHLSQAVDCSLTERSKQN
eukprot:12691290-Ditylum_brightwellii.AAC.1